MITRDLRLPFFFLCVGAMGCHEGLGDESSAAGPGDSAAFQIARAAPDEQDAKTARTVLVTSPTHSCALRDSALFCWGQNFLGQLGTGDLVDSDAAVVAKVAGTDIVQVAVSTGRTCVRRSTGKVVCWGSNDLGQRGDGTRDETLTATAVIGVDDAVDLAIDDMTTCAVRGSGRSVSCWGGSRADGPRGGVPWTPVPIPDSSGVIELRSGVNGEYCGRFSDGSVRCWSLTDDVWTAATKVSVLSGARTIAMVGFGEVCGIIGSGPILCHNLGNGKTVPLDDSAGYVRLIGAGSLATCAVNATGDWACWNVLPPLLEVAGSPRLGVTDGAPFVDFVFSGFRVCALRAKNEVTCGEITDWKLPPLIRVEGLPD